MYPLLVLPSICGVMCEGSIQLISNQCNGRACTPLRTPLGSPLLTGSSFIHLCSTHHVLRLVLPPYFSLSLLLLTDPGRHTYFLCTMSQSDSNTDNVATTITQQPITRPSLWKRFVDSFKPPEGTDPLNDVDPSLIPPRARHPTTEVIEKKEEGVITRESVHVESGEIEEGLGSAENVADGDQTVESDKLKRDLHGRHLQVAFHTFFACS